MELKLQVDDVNVKPSGECSNMVEVSIPIEFDDVKEIIDQLLYGFNCEDIVDDIDSHPYGDVLDCYSYDDIVRHFDQDELLGEIGETKIRQWLEDYN